MYHQKLEIALMSLNWLNEAYGKGMEGREDPRCRKSRDLQSSEVRAAAVHELSLQDTLSY